MAKVGLFTYDIQYLGLEIGQEICDTSYKSLICMQALWQKGSKNLVFCMTVWFYFRNIYFFNTKYSKNGVF